MTRKTVVQCASLVLVSAVTASFGMTSFVTADTITHTGPHSQDKSKPIIKNKCEIYTENNVDIENENKQKAESGNVSIKNDGHKSDGHDKWESEAPQATVQPTSIETVDQPEDQAASDTQATATASETALAEGRQENNNPEKGNENWKPGHEDDKVGDIETGDAINANESKFEVNIETDSECPPIKKMPKAHKPEYKMHPSIQPKATPSKVAAPGASTGAGLGSATAPHVSHQPVARTAQPVQPPAPKPAAPCPPEHAEPVSNHVTTTTQNNVSISNTSYQSAQSGSATVSNNGHVGNVKTGDAINQNSTRASVNIETSNN